MKRFETYLIEERVPSRHLIHGGQRVLHDTHDRTVGLWGDDHTGYRRELTDLSPCLEGLREMKVHLVTIKVSVVRGRYTQVHSTHRREHTSYI